MKGTRIMSKMIVEHVATEFNLTKKLAKEVVDSVFKGIKTEILTEGCVKISDVGTLTVVEKAGRIARNPKTGEEVTVPPKRTVKFKISPSLKRALNSETDE